MGKKKKHKKSGNENKTLEIIVFITAILNLIDGLILSLIHISEPTRPY